MSKTDGMRFAVGDRVRVMRTAEGSPTQRHLGRVGTVETLATWGMGRYWVRFSPDVADRFYGSEIDAPDAPPDDPADLLPHVVWWSGEEETR